MVLTEECYPEECYPKKLKLKLKYLIFFIILSPLFCSAQLSDSDKEFLRQEVANKVNNLRLSKHRKPLIFNDTLRKAAEYHTTVLVETNKLSHFEKKSDFKTPMKRVEAFGGSDFNIVGENILYTIPFTFPLTQKELETLAQTIFDQWKKSPDHYKNMIEKEYVFGDFGFAINPKTNAVFATQVFGAK